MRKPRDFLSGYSVAKVVEDGGELVIRIDTYRIAMEFGWYATPHYARKLGQRLIEMADYVEWRRKQKK